MSPRKVNFAILSKHTYNIAYSLLLAYFYYISYNDWSNHYQLLEKLHISSKTGLEHIFPDQILAPIIIGFYQDKYLICPEIGRIQASNFYCVPVPAVVTFNQRWFYFMLFLACFIY